MPIIITQDILSATEQPVAGWSLAVLKNYTEKPNKKQTGMDSFFVFELLEGPGSSNVNKGRTFIHTVYSSAIEARVSEECRKYIQLLCALTGATSEELIGKEVDPLDYVTNRIWVNIIDEPYEGRILKKASEFSPDGVVPF